MQNLVKTRKITGKLFITLIVLILIIIAFFPKHLCISKRWQCEQYEVTQNKMGRIAMFLRQFQLQKGYFPETLSTLEGYLEQTQKENLRNLKIDPWTNLLLYLVEADRTHFSLYSMGRNGKNEFSEGDDIVLNIRKNREIYCD